MKKSLALFLVAAMTVTSLTACGLKDSASKDADKGSKEVLAGTTEEVPLVVGMSHFSEKFSPFFRNSDYDKQAEIITQVRIGTFDRSGALVANAKDGETIPYNGTDYTYNGLSNITTNYDKATDITTYDVKIRDDVKFSDGKPLTADDIIFTLYVLSDPAYDGGENFGSKPVIGMKNYRANSTAADSITKEEVQAAIDAMPDELAAKIKETIIVPTLTSELDWAASLYGNEAYATYTEKYPKTKDLFAFFYSKDETYDSTKATDEKQVLQDLIAMYGTDYKALGKAFAQDENNFDADVNALAETYVVEQKRSGGEGKEVPNIEGIKKISDTEVQVQTNGYDATVLYNFDVECAPMHYYGDPSLYDYDNNKFGFKRGDLSVVKEKTTTPMGAGPYKFVKYENKVIYYEANENYYLGAPKIKYLQYKESSDADKVTGILQGTIDISDPAGSKSIFNQIKGENSNGELSGDKVYVSTVDNLGYGYIGLNANTVNVAGDPGSDASKNLRKALATILSVYRDVAIDSYYGDAASVIQYPISNTSWAAPQKTDSDYKIAYSTDVEGNKIYTDSMSADDKYEAAKKAALGYLEAAGYTVADGKVTKAPEGGALEYEILIGADGTGDHPSFAVLTDSKAALEEIGITLDINDFADSSQLWTTLDAGTQNLWCAAWQATPDPDMYQVYHSNNVLGKGGSDDNHYALNDPELDQLILAARTSDDQTYRKAIYKQCFDIILDWSVEIPIYQRQNCIIFSPERVNVDTITPDISTYYRWWEEIQNIEMK
ncbi:ABC transporter substrate-binding protein [Clostridium sp. E02]|uniref:ABC transporter substrate-binding protein n=1 Tax=Clostridium sp. E02 TaxID=2487134 RepID=UPI000F53C979|nr:ABC transporter substrate-binding protein [Clostridium sp. E02]